MNFEQATSDLRKSLNQVENAELTIFLNKYKDLLIGKFEDSTNIGISIQLGHDIMSQDFNIPCLKVLEHYRKYKKMAMKRL